eukprot:Hpha_TRINITY_DN16406_c3_g12::TRINITY_DN16406_c3_g12_i1::g.160192::m.160192
MATGGCCKWGWLVRPGDTPDEARIKQLMFPAALGLFLLGTFVIFITLGTHHQAVYIIGLSINAFASVLFMGGVIMSAIKAGYLVDVWVVLCTIGTCTMDLGHATRSYPFRSWAFVVLLLDITLVFKRDKMPHFIIA